MNRTLEIARQRDEFVMDVDGFYYWWPNKGHGGHLAAHHLRALADELDRLNIDWQNEMESQCS